MIVILTMLAAAGADAEPRYALKMCPSRAEVVTTNEGLHQEHEIVRRFGERPCRGPFDAPISWAQFFRIVGRPEHAPEPESVPLGILRSSLVGGGFWTAVSLGHLAILPAKASRATRSLRTA